MKAAHKQDNTALVKALAYFHKHYQPDTVNPVSIIHENLPGNSAGVALSLLVKDTPNTPEFETVIRTLTADWKTHFNIADGFEARSMHSLSARAQGVMACNDPVRIKALFTLLEGEKNIAALLTDRDKWIVATLNAKGMTPTEQKATCLACLREMKGKFRESEITSALHAYYTSEGIKDTPPFTPETLNALLELHFQPEQRLRSNDFAKTMLNAWPAKSTLEAVPYLLTASTPSVVEAWITQHFDKYSHTNMNHADLFPEAWEDRRQGVLMAYSALRPKIVEEILPEYHREHDLPFIKVISQGLKSRLEAAPPPECLDQELKLYAQMGVLNDVVKLAGTKDKYDNNTGFLSTAEYLATLRERAVPAGRDEMKKTLLTQTDWAEYVRAKPLEHAGSAANGYIRGKST